MAALDLVPATSRAFTEARRQRAGLLAGSGRGLPALAAALDSVDGVSIDPLDRARLTADVYDTALREVLENGRRARRADRRPRRRRRASCATGWSPPTGTWPG